MGFSRILSNLKRGNDFAFVKIVLYSINWIRKRQRDKPGKELMYINVLSYYDIEDLVGIFATCNAGDRGFYIYIYIYHSSTVFSRWLRR